MRRRLLFVSLAIAAGLAVTLGVVAADTLGVRYERDVSRMVFNDNLQLLAELRRVAGVENDSLSGLLAANPAPLASRPYLVVSIEERRLWYRSGDSVIFTAEVATGSGKVLERFGEDTHWRFETPRGRLTVVSKDTAPIWVPPDWHYVEEAQRRGLGVVRLLRGQRLPVGEGRFLGVSGSDVMLFEPDGKIAQLSVTEGRELSFGGNIVIPPFGTNQRKYPGVMGTHRLNLGDGYAIHGTNKPETIGRSVSHGCVRLRNEDIARLHELVEVGTPVYLY